MSRSCQAGRRVPGAGPVPQSSHWFPARPTMVPVRGLGGCRCCECTVGSHPNQMQVFVPAESRGGRMLRFYCRATMAAQLRTGQSWATLLAHALSPPHSAEDPSCIVAAARAPQPGVPPSPLSPLCSVPLQLSLELNFHPLGGLNFLLGTVGREPPVPLDHHPCRCGDIWSSVLGRWPLRGAWTCCTPLSPRLDQRLLLHPWAQRGKNPKLDIAAALWGGFGRVRPSWVM